MVESASDVSDLMVELVCSPCPNKECSDSDGMDGGPWSHSRMMDCIRDRFATHEGMREDRDGWRDKWNNLTKDLRRVMEGHMV